MFTWHVSLVMGNGNYYGVDVQAHTELGAKKKACRLWGMPNSYHHPGLRAFIVR